MPRFGLVGPAYRSQSVTADCQTSMNLYLENIESGQGKSAAALYTTPGLSLLYNLGGAGMRGITTAQGRTFAVAGATLWELLSPTANPNMINRGAIVADGKPVSMAGGPTQLLIASAGNLYCFQLTASSSTPANTLTLVQPFNAATGFGILSAVSQVQYSKGSFLALISGTNQIQSSALLDGSIWPGVNFSDVLNFPDNALAIFISHELMWVFGPTKIQPYFNSGNFPFPYDTVEGALIEQGIAAPFSVAALDNSIFWLGGDERGNGIVWRANGYQPVRISNHAIEYEFSTYATIADAACYAYQERGHTFYVMNFPTAQKTWVYDCATQSWAQRGFWDIRAGVFTQSRAGFHTFNFGMHLVGDPTTGAVYQQSLNVYSDFGNNIKRVRRAPHFSNEQTRIVHSELQIDLETGLQTFPGDLPPTFVPMLDVGGVLRTFQMAENGILSAPISNDDVSLARTVFLNDQKNASSWQITITAQGNIQPVQVAYEDFYPVAIPFVSALADQAWTLGLTDLGNGIGQLTATPQGFIGRGPILELRWSNDGGKTWSDPRQLDCGAAGETLTRVIARLLGSARDRVYEISMTDPAPWRIIDGYLFTDEDRQPTSRYAAELRKRA